MFKFLKLRNSVSGDARRHVPFRSIINKHFFLIFAFLFSFVVVVPVKVSAAAPQIRPQFNPILDTDIVNFQDSYLDLDPAAQAAASLLLGAYVTEYAGLADYGYVFDEVPTNATLKERLIFIGDQVVDTIFLPYNMADQLVLTPLINLGQGIINKVKNVTNVDDFYNSILSSENYGLPYTPDIGFALNQMFAREGNLHNWQIYDINFAPFSYRQGYVDNFNANNKNQYNNYVSGMAYPFSVNLTYSMFPTESSINELKDSKYNFDFNSVFATYHNIFINTTSRLVEFYSDEGIKWTGTVNANNYITCFSDRFFTASGRLTPVTNAYSVNYSYTDIIKGIMNYTIYPLYTQGSVYMTIPFNLFNPVFYYGNSWGSRTLYHGQDDLGFTDTDSLQYLNPIKELVFDIKGLIEEIIQAQPDPNYELPLKPIIYNNTQVEGSPLTAEDLQGISFNVTPPESGIDVPVNAFLPMFDSGRGFISYMWYMTKPLISYTRSLLDAITFDPVDGFNASGPGYFILGVAGLGLIGGVIVKFLL